MTKKKGKTKKNNIPKNPHIPTFMKLFDWIILAIFILAITSNILLYKFSPDLMNPISNLLFQLFHLIFGIYFAVRITTFSLMDKTAEVQKSIAKTAIRQIRGTQFMIDNLMGIVRLRIKDNKNAKIIGTFDEINNHLKILGINITSSESAFKDILGEEFKEEHLLWAKIGESINLLNEKAKEAEDLRKKKEEHATEEISKLQNEINDIKEEISTDISSLPITSPGRYSSPISGSSNYLDQNIHTSEGVIWDPNQIYSPHYLASQYTSHIIYDPHGRTISSYNLSTPDDKEDAVIEEKKDNEKEVK